MHLPKEIKNSSEYKELIQERNRPTIVDVIKRELWNIWKLYSGREDFLPSLASHSISWDIIVFFLGKKELPIEPISRGPQKFKARDKITF